MRRGTHYLVDITTVLASRSQVMSKTPSAALNSATRLSLVSLVNFGDRPLCSEVISITLRHPSKDTVSRLITVSAASSWGLSQSVRRMERCFKFHSNIILLHLVYDNLERLMKTRCAINSCKIMCRSLMWCARRTQKLGERRGDAKISR